MKTLRLVGSALFAVLLSVNLTSCGSDDDDSNGGGNWNGVAGGKKIVKIVGVSTESGNRDVETFEYDSEGRLSKVVSIWENESYSMYFSDTTTTDFYWADGTIKVVENIGSYKEISTLTLENGLVQNCKGRANNSYTFQETYTYNDKNQLLWSECISGVTYSATAKWDGDKLLSIYFDGGNVQTVTLAYGSSCSKGYFPFVAEMIEFRYDALYVAHPEIVGMRTNQLPSSITQKSQYENETSKLTYEFDNEGYISKVVTDDYIYTITWQ
jgi:hypothetical protein